MSPEEKGEGGLTVEGANAIGTATALGKAKGGRTASVCGELSIPVA